MSSETQTTSETTQEQTQMKTETEQQPQQPPKLQSLKSFVTHGIILLVSAAHEQPKEGEYQLFEITRFKGLCKSLKIFNLPCEFDLLVNGSESFKLTSKEGIVSFDDASLQPIRDCCNAKDGAVTLFDDAEVNLDQYLFLNRIKKLEVRTARPLTLEETEKLTALGVIVNVIVDNLEKGTLIAF
jgi:hypothetical protein